MAEKTLFERMADQAEQQRRGEYVPAMRQPDRQFITVKFRTEDARAYTYHNDGPPVGAGQEVKLPARVRKGELPDPDAWVRGTVVEIGVPKPEGYETKGILGLAPLKGEEAGDGTV